MKLPKKKASLTNAERHKRFVETAKKVEASEKVEDFDKAFDNLHLNSASRLNLLLRQCYPLNKSISKQ